MTPRRNITAATIAFVSAFVTATLTHWLLR